MLKNLNCGSVLQSFVVLCLLVLIGCDSSLSPEEGMQRAEKYRDKGN